MGCNTSSVPSTLKDDRRRHKEVERELQAAKTKLGSQAKVLLLGSGDSGKSTVLKQMRLIHKIPFTSRERESYRLLVFENVKHGITLIVDAMERMGLAIDEDNISSLETVRKSKDPTDGQPFPGQTLEPMKRLWADRNVQRAVARGNEVALPEHLQYFFSDLDRLFEPEFVPNNLDILYCRARTIGITETVFRTKNRELLMVDVGGQRSERRKWIHCFEDVTCLLFLTSLNGYDNVLAEAHDSNQMQDSMALWDEMCSSQWFKKTAMILFLNKEDLFTERVKWSHIRRIFPDFSGKDADAEAGKEYFKLRFKSIHGKHKSLDGSPRRLYTYFTTATDTKHLSAVMHAVEDIILIGNLETKLL